MTTVQVQVRIPEEMVAEIDRWVKEGRFASRSDAVKMMIALFRERERTRSFYRLLVERSEEAKRDPGLLIPIEEVG